MKETTIDELWITYFYFWKRERIHQIWILHILQIKNLCIRYIEMRKFAIPQIQLYDGFQLEAKIHLPHADKCGVDNIQMKAL